ncbi:tripartite tricarboxylate transporter TctB family protein [Pelagibius litoralis]|uniref:Tripartite tricarboxylate transporter TctB family protein n=1 Tax=Pelagibius litoralis TaxID=374515 RepID=A0A967F1I2_9PROT|nr:tripartite tricarboxylate transporter TctB family protein [Pelagibius litoralis]NIA71426.1 tripartite tricarboxylate transporter TctB family protein [Pelagibius litoralis]
MASKTPRLPVNGTSLVACVTLAASTFMLWHTFDPAYDTAFASAGRGPVFFPRILLVIMLMLSAAVLAQSVTRPRVPETETAALAWRALLSVLLAAVATGLYLYLIYVIGYLLASIAFSFVLPVVFGYRRWVVTATFAAVYATATWYVFEMIFRIVLPKSPWFIYF